MNDGKGPESNADIPETNTPFIRLPEEKLLSPPQFTLKRRSEFLNRTNKLKRDEKKLSGIAFNIKPEDMILNEVAEEERFIDQIITQNTRTCASCGSEESVTGRHEIAGHFWVSLDCTHTQMDDEY